jgi:hypothetical protein
MIVLARRRSRLAGTIGNAMNKIERVANALKGAEVDRPSV